jgi:hypothetical protein
MLAPATRRGLRRLATLPTPVVGNDRRSAPELRRHPMTDRHHAASTNLAGPIIKIEMKEQGQP